MHRRIQHVPLSSGNDGNVLHLQPWITDGGNDEIEHRLMMKREEARDKGFDFDAVELWMGIGATMQYLDGEVPQRGRYGFDGVTDGRRDNNPALANHIRDMPDLIRRLRYSHLGVIAYLGCPRYTNALISLRGAMNAVAPHERQAARAIYRQFWIENLRPFERAQIALDAMASASPTWACELEQLFWRTGAPAIVEGSAPQWIGLVAPSFARDASIISMMRNEKDAAGNPTLDRLTAWPGPERIAWFIAAEDWDFWASVGDRRSVIAKCEAAGVSVCCDWAAV